MSKILVTSLLCSASLISAIPAFASADPDQPTKTRDAKVDAPDPVTAPQSASPQKALFSTGVAKGRDLLDSAISTSAIAEAQVQEIGARSLGEVVRSLAGFRVEAAGDMLLTNYTIRGLPLTGFGSKYVQFQEDGLPVLELGDFQQASPGAFIRTDLTMSRIESIRGGSASTFASNSPGGVINFISRTGEQEGGSVMLTAGLDYGEHRVDFDYGGKLSDTLRFNVGGFYREGSGPRNPGYSAFKGGQVKLNATRDFAGGYVRLYLKVLDDRTPGYAESPIKITGTNDSPTYSALPGFDPQKQMLVSPYTQNFVGLTGDGNAQTRTMSTGAHTISKSAGLEARFDIAEWTITERMRYSSNALEVMAPIEALVLPAPLLAELIGGPGATLSYATGPKKGQVIANPAALNGNGLLSYVANLSRDYNDVGNFVNDIRGTRVWKVGAGDLTLTAGMYKSIQQAKADLAFNAGFKEVSGTNAAMIDLRTAGGTALTASGLTAYSIYPLGASDPSRNDVEYNITAPYGSLNYHIGKLVIGGSIRYDDGRVRGQLYSAALGGGRVGMAQYDINRDGVISPPEMHVGVIPSDSPLGLNYNYDYISYSLGANYRIAPSLAVFARYSRGARAAGDTIFYTPTISTQTGGLSNPDDGYGVVRQSEVGVKYRRDNLALNLTSFLADAHDKNFQLLTDSSGVTYAAQLDRQYRAYGAEFEGSYSYGPWNLAAAATYTHARIRSDRDNPQFNDKTPRHQPNLIAQLSPSYEGKKFSAGAVVVYTGSSYAQDINQLKMPSFTTANAFLKLRPTNRVELMVTASNLFDAIGIVNVTQGSLPTTGIGTATVINGRTVAGSVRFQF